MNNSLLIWLQEEKGAQKEHEKEKLLLKLDNLRTYFTNMEKNLAELQKERTEKEDVLSKSEANVLKAREKMDSKRAELRGLENELREMITEAGVSSIRALFDLIHSCYPKMWVYKN